MAELFRQRSHIVAFTGAGISVDSGIPAFRGAQGLWEEYDPIEYAHIEAFARNPAKVWRMLREMSRLVFAARPSPAHLALGALEAAGFLDAVVTQNVDGLHQEAGNTRVIEYHGNTRRLLCLKCGDKTPLTREALDVMPYPTCAHCDAPLKPAGIFFGEPIPGAAVRGSEAAVRKCEVMLIIGTSGMVYPAAEVPFQAAAKGAAVVEINPESTPFTTSLTRHFLRGRASLILPAILQEMGLSVDPA